VATTRNRGLVPSPLPLMTFGNSRPHLTMTVTAAS
jgi:hypothetical protein